MICIYSITLFDDFADVPSHTAELVKEGLSCNPLSDIASECTNSNRLLCDLPRAYASRAREEMGTGLYAGSTGMSGRHPAADHETWNRRFNFRLLSRGAGQGKVTVQATTSGTRTVL